jgi:hypothetical protein
MAKRTNPNVESVNGGSPAAFIARPEIAASLILKAIGTTWGPLGVSESDPVVMRTSAVADKAIISRP